MQDLGLKIEQSILGDTEAFRSIVYHFQSSLFSYAYRLLGNEEDAKDVIQETFVKTWKNLAHYRKEYAFSTWLYKIATNICYDYLRRKNSKPKMQEENSNIKDIDLNNPYQVLETKEVAALLHVFTGTLTPKQKLVFTLCDLEGKEAAEISAITGISKAKIKSNLYFARKNIKEKLDNYYNDAT